ncbi:MAG: DUF5615 family PIN-like protein [Candidatus Sungiibacteriota bacterium]
MSVEDNNLEFLLDEQMPPRKNLPRLNKRSRFNLRHICHDYKQCGLDDQRVLKIAESQGRIFVTGDADFLKQRQIQKKTAIIKFDKRFTAKEIDNFFLKLVNKFKTREYYQGRILTVTRKFILEHNFGGKQKRYNW